LGVDPKPLPFRQKANKCSLKKFPVFYQKVLTNKKSYVIIITETKRKEIHTMLNVKLTEKELDLIKKLLNVGGLINSECDDLLDALEYEGRVGAE
jgi:hypothetical protein